MGILDVPSYMIGKKAGGGGGGGGTTYTAGTNIEITSENVINNTIPYEYNTSSNSLKLGPNITLYNGSNNNVVIGRNAEISNNSSNSTVVGAFAKATKLYSTAIGNSASSRGDHSTVLGYSASDGGYFGSIAIGSQAMAQKPKQAMFGSYSQPITEMAMHTGAGGIKSLATEDYVNTAISTAITSALGGNY